MDWVGRCIAESKMAAQTWMVTLTYGRDSRYYGVDHPHAHGLFYGDVQRYLKRIRQGVSPSRVRFLVAGEYGSVKGRAHWHGILFFSGGLPAGVKERERFMHEPWPHGWSWWEQSDDEGIRYVTKYITKEGMGPPFYRFSSQPELGREYFRRQAELAAASQLPPRKTYRFALQGGERKPVEYRLTRAALEHYLGAYLAAWKRLWGAKEVPPWSEVLDDYSDRLAGREWARCPEGQLTRDREWALRFAERRRAWVRGLAAGVRTGETQYWTQPIGHAYRRASQGW